MAVDVAGGACLGVPKVFSNNHQRSLVRNQEAGVGMPKLVEAENEAILVEVENGT